MKNKVYYPIILSLALRIIGFCTKTCRAQAQLRATVISYQQVNLSWDRLPGRHRSVCSRAQKKIISGKTLRLLPGYCRVRRSPTGTKPCRKTRLMFTGLSQRVAKSCGSMMNEVKVTTPPAPPANPSQLEAFYISGRGLGITWQGNNGDGTSFLLERSENGGAYVLIATVAYSRTLGYGGCGRGTRQSILLPGEGPQFRWKSGIPMRMCIARPAKTFGPDSAFGNDR